MKTYNKKELNAIKTACGMVHKLLYTFSYKVDLFEVLEDEKENIRINFRIRRTQPFNGEDYTIYQGNHFYIAPTGKMYFYNFMGKQKTLKDINQIAGSFFPNKEDLDI